MSDDFSSVNVFYTKRELNKIRYFVVVYNSKFDGKKASTTLEFESDECVLMKNFQEHIKKSYPNFNYYTYINCNKYKLHDIFYDGYTIDSMILKSDPESM